MSKRGENIRKRKDGRWEARFRGGRGANGEAVYVSVYGRTYKEAKEKKLLMLSKTQIVNRSNCCLSFAEVQQLWAEQNSIRIKPATERKYNYLLQRHILPDIGHLKITQISAPLINTFLADKLKSGRLDGSGGLSAAYVRGIMLIINSVMRFAVAEKYCPPLSTAINKPAVISKEIPILTKQQCEKLENKIITDPSPAEVGILIALYTGMRIGEVCALSWDDIDLENRLISVKHTISRIGAGDSGSRLVLSAPKTSSSLRIIPLCSKLHGILAKYKKNSASRYVVSTTSTFVSPRTFEYRFHAILKKYGVPDIHFHALRHTFATHCVERQIDTKTLSEILGHASETITLKTYVHSSLDLKRTQLEKLNH